MIKILESYSDINTDLNDRWENGIPHHPKSKELMRHISELDFKFNNDYFCWKMGGDGDNGEILMYLMDMYFELHDKKKLTNEESDL